MLDDMITKKLYIIALLNVSFYSFFSVILIDDYMEIANIGWHYKGQGVGSSLVASSGSRATPSFFLFLVNPSISCNSTHVITSIFSIFMNLET